MNLCCWCFHKSGSMFFHRLFQKIAKDNNIEYYSSNNKPDNENLWNNKLDNCILCPKRRVPRNYEENLKYIIHLRNPIDTLISEYYSYGFTHIEPDISDEKEHEMFTKRRKKIQNLTLDEYCLLQENIDKINNKYNGVLNWIEKYKDRENVFISNYDNMYYDFPNWLRNIFDFLSLKTYNETLSMFEKEFENKNMEHIKSDIKTIKDHKRSGLSKQYLVELKKSTLDLLISKLSDHIKNNYDFT